MQVPIDSQMNSQMNSKIDSYKILNNKKRKIIVYKKYKIDRYSIIIFIYIYINIYETRCRLKT